MVIKADVLLTDSLNQTKERGEFQHYWKKKSPIDESSASNDIIEIGTVLTDNNLKQKLTRKPSGDDPRLTIFDTSGVAVQDIQIAKLVSQLA